MQTGKMVTLLALLKPVCYTIVALGERQTIDFTIYIYSDQHSTCI